MQYRVTRTYIERIGKEGTMTGVRNAHLIDAPTASDAALEYIRRRGLRLIGAVEEVTGNTAVATCMEDETGRQAVIRAAPEER